jgi:hypothetical protein
VRGISYFFGDYLIFLNNIQQSKWEDKRAIYMYILCVCFWERGEGDSCGQFVCWCSSKGCFDLCV